MEKHSPLNAVITEAKKLKVGTMMESFNGEKVLLYKRE
jgi:hypothetical protein